MADNQLHVGSFAMWISTSKNDDGKGGERKIVKQDEGVLI